MAKSFGEFVGDGRVLNGLKLIARVRYAGVVCQTYIQAPGVSGDVSVPGLPQVACVLTGLPNNIGKNQEQLTLVMDDGRSLNFYVVDSSGRVQPTGPLYALAPRCLLRDKLGNEGLSVAKNGNRKGWNSANQ